MSHEDILRSSLERAVEREKKARNRSIIYTLIPIAVAIALIWYTWGQVDSATKKLSETNKILNQSQQEMTNLGAQLAQTNKDLADLRTESEKYKRENQELQAQSEKYRTEITDLEKRRNELLEVIDGLGAQIDQATSLEKYLYDGNLMTLYKEIPWTASQNDVMFEILTNQEQGARFLAGGIGPERFDSPGFAAFILAKFHLVPGTPDELHYSLPDRLPHVQKPGLMDIIFYESGYTMFYLVAPDGQAVVVGMTPMGIMVLKYDFAKVLGFGDVNYP